MVHPEDGKDKCIDNKYYLGVMAIDETENYYSIKFKKKTKFSLQVTGKDQATIDITIQDTDGKIIYSDWCYYNTKIFSFDDYLSKGEYNIILRKVVRIIRPPDDIR